METQHQRVWLLQPWEKRMGLPDSSNRTDTQDPPNPRCFLDLGLAFRSSLLTQCDWTLSPSSVHLLGLSTPSSEWSCRYQSVPYHFSLIIFQKLPSALGTMSIIPQRERMWRRSHLLYLKQKALFHCSLSIHNCVHWTSLCSSLLICNTGTLNSRGYHSHKLGYEEQPGE